MLLPLRDNKPDVTEIIRLWILGLIYAYGLAVATAEVVLSISFSNTITKCASLPPLTVYSWLVCDGIVSFCLLIFLIIRLSAKVASLDRGASVTSLNLAEISSEQRQSCFGFIFSTVVRKVVSDVLILFKVSWIIVGSVIFWRDCHDELNPRAVRTIFFQSLVSSFAFIGLICCREICKQNE